MNDLNAVRAKFCMEEVRTSDHTNFLCGTLLPPKARDSYFAFRAFNSQAASIADQVKEPMMGRIRFQFWRDAVRDIYEEGRASENPVSSELLRAVQKHQLTRRWLDRMLDAREADLLHAAQPMTMQEVETYAENTASSLLMLTLESLGVKDVQADHVASHVGKAVGLITILRGTPYHCSKRRTYIPIDLMREHNLHQETMLRGQNTEELVEVAFSMASTAKKHLNTARGQLSKLPKGAPAAFLPALACDEYLEQLRRCDFNLFDPKLARSGHLTLQLQLMKHYWCETY